jgi:hypothetical protein
MKKLYTILLVLSINTYAGSGLLVVKALGDTDSNGVNEYSISVEILLQEQKHFLRHSKVLMILVQVVPL